MRTKLGDYFGYNAARVPGFTGIRIICVRNDETC